MDRPSITEAKDGPLIVKRATRMVYQDGSEVAVKPVMALCRCGKSANKPFCDGTHSEAGFQDRDDTAPEGPDRVFAYEGSEVTVTFNPRLCVHAAECGRIAQSVFNPAQKPWVQPDAGAPADIEAVVAACPSGALKMAPAGDPPADLFDEARATVTIQKDGPYWVQDADAPVPPQGEGMSPRKFALCRCGMSGAKPYCDGSHRAKGWKDD